MLGAVVAGPGQASLGGDVASVRRDHALIGATDHVTATLQYDVHEGAGTNGRRIREYVDRGGKVFAVTWQGPHAPDIAGLLGAYAARYAAAARIHRGSPHVLVIADPDLSVNIIRLPQAFPPGVTRAEIR